MVAADAQHTELAAGPARTSQVLSGTRNRAVIPLLLAGLRSSRASVRAAAIRAAVRRHDSATHTHLIRHFGDLSEADQAVLAEAHAALPHHAAPALKAAVLEGDATLCKNACRIIALSCDADLFPVLVKAAESKKHHHRDAVSKTILELASGVVHELAQWAGGERAGHHDPSFKRHHLLVSLEQSLARFAQHHCREVLDAFLLLAPIENKTLQQILHDPRHPGHGAVATELASTQDCGIIERFVEMLGDINAPPAALEIMSRRADQKFVDILLNGLPRPVPVRVLHNMTRLRHVAWLEDHRRLLVELDGRAQAIAVDLATSSGMSHDRIFDLLVFLMREGLAEGRRASCQALAKFDTAEADKLVLSALDDPDSGVQATAVRQLRIRRLPDALQRLVALLDSRSPEVRDAARSSLAEFNFTRYRTMYDLLDEQAVKSTGVLVYKVDHTAQQKLLEELAAPSITSKLRGIEMAVAMEAANDLRQQLIELASHENVTVRKEAVTALAHCRGEQVIAALMAAAADTNRTVAEAAQRSLAGLPTSETQSSGAMSFAGESA